VAKRSEHITNRAHDDRTAMVAIVDDHQAVRKALSGLIKSIGLRVEAFGSARDFLNSSTREQTACLILDVVMPGMSGLELQQYLATIGSRIPIIFITARADEDVRARAFNAGALGFLAKPFREEDLLQALRRALEGATERR
jgi:FixJ family two-component response regulator